jgi:CheY-like chemotaxis protein
MGWKEILGTREAPDKEPALVDRQMILAYMEELNRLRTPCQLLFRKDDFAPAAVKVESVSEEAENFVVSLSRALPSDIEQHPSLELTFPLERGRFRCSVHYQGRTGYLKAVLGLPLRIKLAERRVAPRARFGPRERASVTLIESLGSGLGATGKLWNLSMGGLAMRVERMISIADDRRLNPSATLFTVGKDFLLLRISDLSRSPMVECGARLSYATATPAGILLGLEFKGLGALETRILEQVIHRRLPRSGTTFPVRIRHSRMDLLASAAAQGGAAEEDWDVDEESELEAERIEAAGSAGTPLDDDHAWLDRSDPKEKVKRLRRAGRNILLVMAEDLDRAILAGTLIVDGFRRLKEARNFSAAVESIRAVQPDVLILDQCIGSHDAKQFLERLRQHGLAEDAKVVMLADKADVKTALMAKLARVDHMQLKPVDYDGSLRNVLERMLNL